MLRRNLFGMQVSCAAPEAGCVQWNRRQPIRDDIVRIALGVGHRK